MFPDELLNYYHVLLDNYKSEYDAVMASMKADKFLLLPSVEQSRVHQNSVDLENKIEDTKNRISLVEKEVYGYVR